MADSSTDLQFLTVPEVARLLKVSPKSILRWAKADASLPVLRVGRVLRFDRDRLLSWLRTKTQGFGRQKTQKMTHDEGEIHVNT